MLHGSLFTLRNLINTTTLPSSQMYAQPFVVSVLVFSPSMDLRLLPVIGFLSLALVATSATLTSEDYWHSMLPNTPMPKAIRDLLPSDSEASVDVRKVNFGRKGIGSTVNPEWNSEIDWHKGASKDQLRDDPNVALFIQEKDLRPGTTMNLDFTKTRSKDTFLSRQEAQVIPFSSNKFSNILQQFSVIPGSNEAQVMKNTIQECEKPAIEGEEKYCATSLESMVDFSISKLGTNVKVVSTEVDKEESQKQKYTITSGVEKMASDDVVVCHGQPYAYAVFYCHVTRNTRAYKVPLVGTDGTKANAIVVCHGGTAKWNPKQLAFQVLKVKPGATICHDLSMDQVLWVHN